MTKTYDDPVKQKSREKLREFIGRNLSIKNPKKIKVVCFPGAEVDGEEALEVKEVYDQLGIPRENIVGLEADRKRAARLERSDLGIQVVHSTDLEFFKTTDTVFDVISLDYTGYRDESKWQVLHEIAGRQLLWGGGILATNYSIRRENISNQAQMIALQFDAHREGNSGPENIESLIADFKNGVKLNLAELRDNLTMRTLEIMRMGSSAKYPLEILTMHPYHKEAQKLLIETERETRERNSDVSQFLVEHRVESGMGMTGASNPLSYLYRKLNLDLLAFYIRFQNEISLNLSRFITNVLIDTEMQSYSPRSMERYSYTSNKNAIMHMDLIWFNSAGNIYRKIVDKISYNESTGRVKIDLNMNRLSKISNEIAGVMQYEIPARIDLGSSWISPKQNERISKEDAVGLLRGECSPKEIAQCYSGFTIAQLAAFKAHYITMGKKLPGEK